MTAGWRDGLRRAVALTLLAGTPAAASAEPPLVLPSGRGAAMVAVGHDGGLAWRAPLDGRMSGVVAAGPRVVAAVEGGLVAFDAVTGAQAWRLSLAGRPTAPVSFAGAVVVGTAASALVAVDPESGAVVWSLDAGGPISGRPAVSGDLLLVATRQREALAVTADGQLRWRVSVSGRVTAGTAATADILYIAALDGRLTGIDLATGRTRLAAPLPRPVDDGLVVARDAEGRDLLAARLEDGTVAGFVLPAGPGPEPRPAWTFAAGSEAPAPAAGHGLVYVAGRDLVALDAVSGRVVWRLTETLAKGFGRALTRRLVERERGLSPEEVRAARAASPYELRGAILRSPVVAGHLVLAATDEGFLYAVDAVTGMLRWRVAEGD